MMAVADNFITQIGNAVITALARFTSDTRLYDLKGEGQLAKLTVEGYVASDALSSLSETQILALSTDAHLDLQHFIGQPVELQTSLADGTRTSQHGLIRMAEQIGSNGGLARYRLTVVPWLWLTTQQRHNRVFQDQSVLDIVEHVFSAYQPHAAWVIGDEVTAYLEQLTGGTPRPYVVQYRESDFTFVTRLLAESGIGFTVVHDQGGKQSWPAHHAVKLFSDSASLDEDYSSLHQNGGAGIRFHRSASQEDQDSIQALGAVRQLHASNVTVLSWDAQGKRSVAASVPTQSDFGKHGSSNNLAALEHYDPHANWQYSDSGEAERYATLLMQSLEARQHSFIGRSTVRTFNSGSNFDLTQSSEASALAALDDLMGNASGKNGASNNRKQKTNDYRFLLSSVTHVGINNLPKGTQADVAALLGDSLRVLQTSLHQLVQTEREQEVSREGYIQSTAQTDYTPLFTQAQKTGYANQFTSLKTSLPWRPALLSEDGTPLHPPPLAAGLHSALVVGPQGETSPSGANEIYCDAQGRIKLRFHWQDGQTLIGSAAELDGNRLDNALTCWVRVAQQQAGPGMGWQLLPRIGQEVLVTFLESDINRPLVIAGAYNGQGEGGTAPTPGSEQQSASNPTNLTVFDGAHDHALSAQGNLVGANSPAWHGASAVNSTTQGHGNAAALSGIKSKEFGNFTAQAGFNQLVFDDTPGQLRTQLASSQYATQLNLGHLIHQSDNYRGSFRGLGAELRTDAYGALRASKGILISTYGSPQTTPAEMAQPIGDNAPGMALLKQISTLSQTFDGAADTHKTVKLASHNGAIKGNVSMINDKLAPLKALHTAASGMVSSVSVEEASEDAANKNTAVSSGSKGNKVPHSSAALITVAAKGGLGMVAGQNIQLNNGQTLTLASGQDSNYAVAGQSRIHTGQAIGILAGAIKPGEGNAGIQMIAAKDKIDVQAQADEMKVQSQLGLKVISASASVDFAGAKKIRLAVKGGASITIENGNITVQCPGKIAVHAGQKSFSGPTQMKYQLPHLPQHICKECLLKAAASSSMFAARS
jgi:type VI secretion system secreted protein VgrG